MTSYKHNPWEGRKVGRKEHAARADAPMNAVLWCPNCFEQHIDEANPDKCQDCGHNAYCHAECTGKEFSPLCRGDNGLCKSSCKSFNPWLNPPHKSHRCEFCNHVWRPAEGPTNGVLKLAKQGERDGFARPTAFANKRDFDSAVATARADAPADVCEWCANAADRGIKHDVAVCVCKCHTQFTPAPTSPERRSEWIPVSERLPDSNGEYFVTTKEGELVKRWYGGSEGAFNTEHWLQYYQAWMPLPKPYIDKLEGKHE